VLLRLPLSSILSFRSPLSLCRQVSQLDVTAPPEETSSALETIHKEYVSSHVASEVVLSLWLHTGAEREVLNGLSHLINVSCPNTIQAPSYQYAHSSSLSMHSNSILSSSMFYAQCANVMQSVPGCGTVCRRCSTLSHRLSRGVFLFLFGDVSLDFVFWVPLP